MIVIIVLVIILITGLIVIVLKKRMNNIQSSIRPDIADNDKLALGYDELKIITDLIRKLLDIKDHQKQVDFIKKNRQVLFSDQAMKTINHLVKQSGQNKELSLYLLSIKQLILDCMKEMIIANI